MMKNYSSPPSRFYYPFHKPKNINDHHHDHDYQHLSLENHKKTLSVSNPSFNSIPGPINNITQNDILLQPQTNKHTSEDKGTLKKITKITFFSSSSRQNHNHDDGKLKNHICNKVFSSHNALNGHMRWHTQKGSKKGIIHPPAATTTTSFERKPHRRRRYMNIDDDVIAAQTLLHIYRGGYGAKRQKLSCGISDIDETLMDNSHNEKKKLVLRLKIPKEKIFETSQDCKEPADNHIEENKKKINEGETKLGSKVVKNFDLNELPSDYLEDESK